MECVMEEAPIILLSSLADLCRRLFTTQRTPVLMIGFHSPFNSTTNKSIPVMTSNDMTLHVTSVFHLNIQLLNLKVCFPSAACKPFTRRKQLFKKINLQKCFYWLWPGFCSFTFLYLIQKQCWKEYMIWCSFPLTKKERLSTVGL